MASLDILYSNPPNLKNEITKIERRKSFVANWTFWKIFYGASIYA